MTKEQLQTYFDTLANRLVGKENASAHVTIRGGRFNVTVSEDEVLVQNGKILGQDKGGERQ